MQNLFLFLTIPILAQETIPFKPLYPIDTTVYGEQVKFQWENLIDGYEYKFEILTRTPCDSIKMSLYYSPVPERTIRCLTDGNYCWRLKYRLIGESDFETSELYRFTYKKEQEIIPEEVIPEDPVIPEPPDEQEVVTPEETAVEEVEEEVVETSSPEPNPPQTQTEVMPAKERLSVPAKNVEERQESVLGEQDKKKVEEDPPSQTVCSFVFDKRGKKYSDVKCNIDFPEIKEAKTYSVDGDYDYTVIKGSLDTEILVDVEILECEKFSIVKPSTWLKCNKVERKKQYSAHLIYSPNIKIKGKRATISAYETDSGEFFLRVFSDKLNNEKLSLGFDIYFYINIEGYWIDIRKEMIKEISLPRGNISSGENPFSYLFDSLIGVTQWHGYTAYSSPHTGIDFGSVHKPILSPMAGTIYEIGFDTYYGECNSGGKYIKVKHDNGMYTVYMHLDSYKKSDGTEWKTGEKVKKGEQIGISGNSGAYNCQPLGYHLHYELRGNAKQSSHTDPVPYTNVNWDLIPTINWQKYPGRLSGDNPHPNF